THKLFELLPPLFGRRRFGDADVNFVRNYRWQSDFLWWNREQSFGNISDPFEKIDHCVGVKNVHYKASRFTSFPIFFRIVSAVGISFQVPAASMILWGQHESVSCRIKSAIHLLFETFFSR